MMKFVTGRMNEVLEKGRAGDPSNPATEEEKEAARVTIGNLTWAAKEGRPDPTAVANLIALNMSRLKIQDIQDLNRYIRQVRSRPDLKIKIQSIPLDRLCWGVITDVSYANTARGKS